MIFLQVIFLAISFILPAYTFAENATTAIEENLNSDSWENTFARIKAESDAALEQNKKLKTENQALSKNLIYLQSVYSHAQDQNQKVLEQINNLDTLSGSVEAVDSDLYDKIQILEDKIALENKGIDQLNQQLIVLNQKKQILDLKNSDLQLQKDTLELEVKDNQSVTKAQAWEDNPKIRKLQNQLSDTQSLEKKLAAQVAQLQEIQPTSPEMLRQMEEKSQQLSAEFKAMQAQKKQIIKDNEFLKREYLNALRLAEIGYPQKQQEKEELTVRVKQLEDQVAMINSNVDTASNVQVRKRQLINEMMTIDRENQSLRKKIQDVKK